MGPVSAGSEEGSYPEGEGKEKMNILRDIGTQTWLGLLGYPQRRPEERAGMDLRGSGPSVAQKRPQRAGKWRERAFMKNGGMTAEKFCAELGREIRQARVEKRMSQEELAGRVGLHRNSVARY